MLTSIARQPAAARVMRPLTETVWRGLALLDRDYRPYGESRLPPIGLRLNGVEFADDGYFLASGQKEVDRLVRLCGLSPRSHLLEVGCGPGRLPIGILSRLGPIERYEGVDVNRRVIDWCRRHITRRHPTFCFHHIDVQNDMYNPGGVEIRPDFRFPYADQAFDIIYLWGVFTNIGDREVACYLKEFARLLRPAGRLFFTAFMEDGVPDVTVNPAGYIREWRLPCSCVRYNRAYLLGLVERSGLPVDRFDYADDVDGMSAVHASPQATTPAPSPG
jgi:SAM-dependent methyltransferase